MCCHREHLHHHSCCHCGCCCGHCCGCHSGCCEGGRCTYECCEAGASGFRRRYRTRAERISELEAYLADLKAEVQAVEEHLKELRRE